MSDGLRQGWYDSSMVWEDRTSRLTSRWTPRGLPGSTKGGDMREYFKLSD